MIQLKSFSTCLFIALLLMFTGTTVFAAAGTRAVIVLPVVGTQEVLGDTKVKAERKTKWKPFAAVGAFPAIMGKPLELKGVVNVLLLLTCLLLIQFGAVGMVMAAMSGSAVGTVIGLIAAVLGITGLILIEVKKAKKRRMNNP